MKYTALAFILVLSILLGSCRTIRYNNNLKEGFIQGFKTLSFCSCVENANDRKLDLWEEDVSCRTPDYLYAENLFIDSLARMESDRIRRVEAERTTQRAEGMEGKQIISGCLAFYNSKKLDEIAKARYKRDKKLRLY